jgi:hypothetical protein
MFVILLSNCGTLRCKLPGDLEFVPIVDFFLHEAEFYTPQFVLDSGAGKRPLLSVCNRRLYFLL